MQFELSSAIFLPCSFADSAAMKFILQGLIICAFVDLASSRFSALSKRLSRIGKNFGGAGDVKKISLIGDGFAYTYAAVGTFWRSNALAAFSKMKIGEQKEAIESMNLAIATLAVWDVGQGMLHPVADKLIQKIVKHQKGLFAKTMASLKKYRTILGKSVLRKNPTKGKALKMRLLDMKGKITAAFQMEVDIIFKTGKTGNFLKNTAIFKQLRNDLTGVKIWAKAATWADVFAGPLFDAATVAVGAWQLSEAIESGDGFAIASCSLSIASGVAGIVGFTVGALATAGSTLAAVAGPVGAVVGAILGIASILVEVAATAYVNPYTAINKDIDLIKTLTTNSQKQLDINIENLNLLFSKQTRIDFEFSWVFQSNEGLMLEYVRGRGDEMDVPLKFRLKTPPKEEDGYIVIGKNKDFDKDKYPKTSFVKPTGLIKIGYDFYGKNVAKNFEGVTIFVSSNLVAQTGGVLKGVDIETFNEKYPSKPDNVVIDEMYNIRHNQKVAVRTGGGDDAILINGIFGQQDVTGDFMHIIANGSSASIDKETDILSCEGMPTDKTKLKFEIHGVFFVFEKGIFAFLVPERDQSGKKISGLTQRGHIFGIKMFVGSPYNDEVYISTNHNYIVRQTKGNNKYIVEFSSWKLFKIIIDDQSNVPGLVVIRPYLLRYEEYGEVKSSFLRVSDDRRTLFVYGKMRGKQRAPELFGRILFNRRNLARYNIIRTEPENIQKSLNEFPTWSSQSYEGPDNFNSGKDYHYKFDHDLRSGDCGVFKVFLHPPVKQLGKYGSSMYKTKHSNDLLILTTAFIEKCIHKARRAVSLVRSGSNLSNATWTLRLEAADDLDNNECPGKFLELDIPDFEKVMKERTSGEPRLVVDLYREKRSYINIAIELEKLSNRQDYHLNKNLAGTFGIPQVVVLGIPVDDKPWTLSKYTIDMKGGQKLNEDSIVITKTLLAWLKGARRKIMLTKKQRGIWKLEIILQDGDVTHEVTLENIERIDYEEPEFNKKEVLREPVISDLATETESPVNLITRIQKLLRSSAMQWAARPSQCD